MLGIRTSQRHDSARLVALGDRAAARRSACSVKERSCPTCGCWCGGKDVDHAIDGLDRAVGVQRAEDQVTGFGHGQRHLDRLDVAKLADQDEVRVLAQDALERGVESTWCRRRLRAG